MANSNLSADPILEVRPTCDTCGSEKWWKECWNCEDGYSDHDCGEDCCMCLHPENNVRCDICRGAEGFYVCPKCYPASFDDE